MVRHDVENGGRKGGFVRAGIRSVSGAVGLASESIKSRKTERQSPQGERPTAPRSESAHAVSESLSTSQADEAGGDLENEWNLDDAQDQVAEGQTRTAVDAEPKLTFFEKYCQKTDRLSAGQLALPVVLPQRRPRDRSRGFIRAYAPMLQDVSIDQTTWLDFLDTLLISFVSGGKLIPGPNSRGLIGGFASVIRQAARGEKQGSEWESYAVGQRQNAQRQEKRGIIPNPIRTYKKLLAKVGTDTRTHRHPADPRTERTVFDGRKYAIGGRNGNS